MMKKEISIKKITRNQLADKYYGMSYSERLFKSNIKDNYDEFELIDEENGYMLLSRTYGRSDR